ncbi:MAG: hypothetical protein ACKVOE_07810 [Rickettsiales bacterium]
MTQSNNQTGSANQRPQDSKTPQPKNQQSQVGDNTRKDDIRDANKTGGMKDEPTGSQKPGQGSKVA